MVATKYLLGIRLTVKGLIIDPTIPGDWKGCEIMRVYRGCELKIDVENLDGVQHDVKRIHTFDSGSGIGLNEKTTKLMSELFFRDGMHPDMPIMSLGAVAKEVLEGMAPVEFISCGPDDLYQQGRDCCDYLRDAGVDVEFKEFEKSIHGFIEVNYAE